MNSQHVNNSHTGQRQRAANGMRLWHRAFLLITPQACHRAHSGERSRYRKAGPLARMACSHALSQPSLARANIPSAARAGHAIGMVGTKERPFVLIEQRNCVNRFLL